MPVGSEKNGTHAERCCAHGISNHIVDQHAATRVRFISPMQGALEGLRHRLAEWFHVVDVNDTIKIGGNFKNIHHAPGMGCISIGKD
jgi:hypothetical protein